MNEETDVLHDLKKKIDCEMQHLYLQERTKQRVLDTMKGGNNVRKKWNAALILAMVLVVLTAGVAIGTEGLNLFEQWRQVSEEESEFIATLAQEAEMLENVVWEVAADGDFAGMKVIFDQVHFDGKMLTVGLHYDGVHQDFAYTVYDVPFEEKVLDYKSENQDRDLIDFLYYQKADVEGAWTRAQYQTYVDLEVDGVEYGYRYGNFNDYDQEIYGHLFSLNVEELPDYEAGEEIELTFVARHHRLYTYLDENGVLYEMGEDQDPYFDTFKLVLKPDIK